MEQRTQTRRCALAVVDPSGLKSVSIPVLTFEVVAGKLESECFSKNCVLLAAAMNSACTLPSLFVFTFAVVLIVFERVSDYGASPFCGVSPVTSDFVDVDASLDLRGRFARSGISTPSSSRIFKRSPLYLASKRFCRR